MVARTKPPSQTLRGDTSRSQSVEPTGCGTSARPVGALSVTEELDRNMALLAVDRERRDSNFSGIAFEMGEYAVWSRGCLIGWVPNYMAGERLLAGLS